MKRSRVTIALATSSFLLAIVVAFAFGQLAWALVIICLGVLGVVVVGDRQFARWSVRPLQPTGTLPQRWRASAESIVESITNSRTRSKTLLDGLKRVRTTLDHVPDAWIMLKSNTEIELFNRAAQDLLGINLSDAGNDLSRLIRNPSLTHMLEGRSTELVEITSPVDEQKRLEVRMVQLDQDRNLFLARDVTELNRLLTMRQDFIANVSHELRTPLTVLLGYVESMVNDDLDEETIRTLITRLVAPVDRMRFMVDDLLTLTKLESAPMPNTEDVQLINGKLQLELVLEEVSSLVAKNTSLRLHADDLYVPCIPTELHSAFSNLITNAIRYSPDGGNIEIHWQRHNDCARFTVKDEGIGIPPEFISRLTERFYRIDMKGSRARGGTGLGLAIVKHVLRRHQSELHIESEVGKGSRFCFDLPLEQGSVRSCELAN